jgi:hypothetical protein
MTPIRKPANALGVVAGLITLALCVIVGSRIDTSVPDTTAPGSPPSTISQEPDAPIWPAATPITPIRIPEPEGGTAPTEHAPPILLDPDLDVDRDDDDHHYLPPRRADQDTRDRTDKHDDKDDDDHGRRHRILRRLI